MRHLPFLLWLLVAGQALGIPVNGQLKKAQLEQLSGDPTGTLSRIYYNTTSNTAKLYNGVSWTDVGSGGGSGLNNAVDNGNAETASVPAAWGTYNDGASATPVDATGGSATNITAIARDTTGGDIINGTASWKFVKSAANAQGQGWHYDFTVPANWSGRNSLVALNMNYYFSTAVGSEFRVYIYDVTNSTLITPQVVACGSSLTTPTLAPTTAVCQAKLAFVASNATSYRLAIHIASTDSVATTLVADDVYIGDAISNVGSSAVVSQWQDLAPSLGTANTKSPTNLRWRQVGESIEMQGIVTFAGAGTGNLAVNIPSNYHIDDSKLSGGSSELFGSASYYNVTSNFPSIVAELTNTQITFLTTFGGTDSGGSANMVTFDNANTANNHSMTFWVSLPIVELTGTGTTLTGTNNVEYACNTSTSDANDTTSFSHGPQGCLVPSTLTATRNKRVNFKSAIAATDQTVFEISVDQITWLPLTANQAGNLGAEVQNAASYGAYVSPVDGNDVNAVFNQYYLATGATYGAAGGDWATLNGGGYHWRLKKFASGVPVPFGLAKTTLPGLYVTGHNPASVDGTDAAVGEVGQYVTGVSGLVSAVSSGTVFNMGNIVIPPGDWDVYLSAQISAAFSTTAEFDFYLASSPSSGSSFSGGLAGLGTLYFTPTTVVTGSSPVGTAGPVRVKTTAGITLYANAVIYYSGATPSANFFASARAAR